MGKNVTGWVDAADIGLSAGDASGSADPATDTRGQAGGSVDEDAGAGTGEEIAGLVESLTYVDNAADNSDSIDITLDAQDSGWLNGWLPDKGATLRPKILGFDWERPGDHRRIECGLFVLDDVSFSDAPTTLQLGGVSKPSDSDFSELEPGRPSGKTHPSSGSGPPSRRGTDWASPTTRTITTSSATNRTERTAATTTPCAGTTA